MALKIYKKSLDYSYAIGVFPTIALLTNATKYVKVILLHSNGIDSDGVKSIIQLCNQNNIKYDIADRTISKLSIKENTYAIGVFHKYNRAINPEESHVVLVNPSNPGNVGTIIRTMVGFGIYHLAIIKPGVDIFDPKVVRASMGSLFDIHSQNYDTFNLYSMDASSHTIYPFMLNGKYSLDNVDIQRPYSLVFGNESAGLSNSFSEYDNTITIDHSNKIDSLNLSVSAGIGIWKFSQNK